MGEILQQLGGGAGAQQPGRSIPGAMPSMQQPQQPPPQFGPESLVALLSNLFMGGDQGAMVPGQAGGNTGMLGHASFSALLPMLLAHLMPPPQAQQPGAGRQTQPVARRAPTGGMGGSPIGNDLARQPDPSMGASSMLGQLGLV